MRILVGIDDTDNKESRGTGFLSRALAALIMEKTPAVVLGITRHQLLVDDRIPYTSQNSSACLDIEADQVRRILDLSRTFLKTHVATGSDAGLCMAPVDLMTHEIESFGKQAKEVVLSKSEAIVLAQSHKIILEGISGDQGGIIGALAAVGLRRTGNDGRFIWLKGKKELRDVLPGVYEVQEIMDNFDVNIIGPNNEVVTDAQSRICLGDWVRPILKDHTVCLVVERASDNKAYDWQVASKEFIRSIS
jgi:tRNA(Ile2) C34 agmatinyltransferase TiaS